MRRLADPPYLAFPFRVSDSGPELSDRSRHLREQIEQVLFTNPGERVNRPEFGCGLRQLVFLPNSDVLATATQQLVQGSLQRWLGDVIAVEKVDVRSVDAQLEITVVYLRRDLGERREDVFTNGVPA